MRDQPVGMPLTVVGLGHVGMSLIREACRAGFRVSGLDISGSVVSGLAAGKSHVDDISDIDIASMLTAGFTPTCDENVLSQSAIVVICVPTPLHEDGRPDLGAVRDAATKVSRHLRKGTLVVLESTSYPGTTDEVVRPILEQSGLVAGADFSLAFSPERLDPGNKSFGLRNTPKVVGGLTCQCTDRARHFYLKVCDVVTSAKGTREAEMSKLLENTYRHVNIALINEMAMFCHELGIDLRDAISAASTKPFGFEAFFPGPGVGGHCIPIDPNYLSYKVRMLGYPFRFVELAQEINQRMPAYIVERVRALINDAGKLVRGSTILILGLTYKANVADQRESPARPVARRLRQLGANLVFHDPYVDQWDLDGEAVPRVEALTSALRSVDLSLLLQAHAPYDEHTLAKAQLLFDTRGVCGSADGRI